MIRNNSFWNKLFSSSIALVVLIAAVGLIIYSIFKERNQQMVLNENIRSLEEEIASLSGRNLELSQMVKYFKSEEYVEYEAREKLNMLKSGEKVVIVPAELQNQRQVAGVKEEKTRKNWEKWIDYFFALKN